MSESEKNLDPPPCPVFFFSFTYTINLMKYDNMRRPHITIELGFSSEVKKPSIVLGQRIALDKGIAPHQRNKANEKFE